MIHLPSINIQRASGVLRGLTAMVEEDPEGAKQKALETMKNAPDQADRWGASMFATNRDDLFNESEFIPALLKDSDPWIRAKTTSYADAWFPLDYIKDSLTDEEAEVRRMGVLKIGHRFPLDIIHMLKDPSERVVEAVVFTFNNSHKNFDKWGLVDKEYRDILREGGVENVPVDRPEGFKPRYSKGA